MGRAAMSEAAPRRITLETCGKPTRVLRAATYADIATLLCWDADPTVIASGADNPDAVIAWGEDNDWAENIDLYERDVWEYWIAEVDGRPICCMQLCDPHLEPTHYWGEIEPNLRALDIWIGEPDARGRGHGEMIIRFGIAAAFEGSSVTAIIIDPLASNARAHTFYQRLGFVPVERRMFGEDDPLIHKLTREDWSKAFTRTPKSPKLKQETAP